jgi:nitroreductase
VNVYSAIQRRRTIRRFKEQEITDSELIKMIDGARVAPSAGNFQPLEFITVKSRKNCEALFPCLVWARHVKGGDAPPEGNRPAAYIIVLINREIISKGGGHDVGAAVQNVMLAAIEDGLGSCWLRSIDREKIKEIFKVPEHCEIDSVIAIGRPAESPRTESAHSGDIKYWRDEHGMLHVPKRKLDNVLHKEKY